MSIQFGNLKDRAISAAAKKNGVPDGKYQVKLVSMYFDNSNAGLKQVLSEWVVLRVYSVDDLSKHTQEEIDKSRGKKFKIKFSIQGPHEELGKDMFAEHLGKVTEGTGLLIENYQTEKDMETLFLELAAYTIIREGSVKLSKKDPRYQNWSIKKDRSSAPAAPVAEVAPAAVVAPAAQPTAPVAEAPVVQPAPTPASFGSAVAPAAPAAPKTAAEALFG